MVSGVAPGSPAFRSGLRPGDIIMRVNYKRVRSVSDFHRLIRSLKESGKRKALLLVRRKDNNLYVVLNLE